MRVVFSLTSCVTKRHTARGLNNAPVHQSSHAQSRASVRGAVPAAGLAAGLEAASFVTGLPTNADALAALAGDNRVQRTFNIAGETPSIPISTVFGINTLSGGYGASAAGAAFTYSSSAAYSIDLSTTTLDRLVVGLLDPMVAGSPDSIRFRIEMENVNVFDTTIHPDFGCSMFDNQLIDLGAYAGVSGDLDIVFTLDVTASQPGAEFTTQFLFGDTQLVAPLPLEADFDGSTLVAAPDLTIWKANFGDLCATHPEGDANYDNIVDGTDFLLWQRQLGATFPPSVPAAGSVPEPSTALLFTMVLTAAVAMRRR